MMGKTYRGWYTGRRVGQPFNLKQFWIGQNGANSSRLALREHFLRISARCWNSCWVVGWGRNGIGRLIARAWLFGTVTGGKYWVLSEEKHSIREVWSEWRIHPLGRRACVLGKVLEDARTSRSFYSRQWFRRFTRLGCGDGLAGYQRPRVSEGIDTTSRHK